MSLVNLNSTDVSVSLPRYDPNVIQNPTQTDTLSNFGWASDVNDSNTLMAIAAPSYNRNAIVHLSSLTFTPSTITNYVYIYQNVDFNWTLIQTITNPGLDTDNFGFDLSFSTTDGSYLAIGTFNRSSAVAKAYVYTSDGAETPTFSLADASATFDSGNHAVSDATNIGFRVKLDNDGDHLLLMGTTGIIFQFARSGNVWALEAANTLTATGDASTEGLLLGLDANSDHSTIVRGSPFFPLAAAKAAQTGIVEIFVNNILSDSITGSAGDRIGAAVAISNNSNYIAFSTIKLAADLDLRVQNTDGTVSIYVLVGSTYTLQQVLIGSDTNANIGSFGSALALSTAGNKIVIGDAYNSNYGGAAYIYIRTDDDWGTLSAGDRIANFEFDSSEVDNEVVTLTSSNNTFTIRTPFNATTYSVDLTTGSYNSSTLATELGSKLSTATGDVYTVTNTNQLTFTITTDGNAFEIILGASTLTAPLGFASAGSITSATSQTSTQLSTLLYSGTEMGRDVSSSDEFTTYATTGLPGKLRESITGVGLGIVFFSTASLNLFQSALTIDTTDSSALLVRRNNNTQDVFKVDTTTGVSPEGAVISEGILCANNTQDSTSTTTGSVVVKGGVGIAKSVNIGTDLTVINDTTVSGNFIQDLLSSSFAFPEKNKETTVNTTLALNDVQIINDEMFVVASAQALVGSAINITSISKANSAIITTTAPHGFTGFEQIVITGNDLNNPTANIFGTVEFGASGSTFEIVGGYDTTASSGGGLGGTVQETTTTGLTLIIYDISNPEVAPTQISSTVIDSGTAFVANVYITGRYLFTANQSTSIFVMDIIDRTAPVLVNTFTTGILCRRMSGDGKYIFLSSDTQTEIIDFSDPLNPVTVSTTAAVAGFASFQNHSRGHLYIGDRRIIDYSDIRNPVSIHDSGSAIGGHMQIQGNYMYGASSTTFYIRNISETDNITTESSSTFLTSTDHFLNVYGNLVFVVSLIGGLITVIDVSDVVNPVVITQQALDVGQLEQEFIISRNYMYIFAKDEVLNMPTTLRRFTLPTADVPLLESGKIRAGELTVLQNLKVGTNIHVNGSVQGMGSANFSGFGSNGINSLGTFSGTDNPFFTVSTKRTGSFDLGDGNVAAGTTLGAAGTLLFTGHKMFVIECYVAVDTTTPLLSNYRLVGVNESISGDAWTLAVTRNGATDPLVVFAIDGPSGQLQYSIAVAYSGTFSSNTLYFEIVSDFV